MPNVSLIGQSPDNTRMQSPIFRQQVGGASSTSQHQSTTGTGQDQALKTLQTLEMLQRIRKGAEGGSSPLAGMMNKPPKSPGGGVSSPAAGTAAVPGI